jgi:hypothetical protein
MPLGVALWARDNSRDRSSAIIGPPPSVRALLDRVPDDDASGYAPSYGYAAPSYGYAAPAAPAVAGTSWYYCQTPAGYYPYVQQCMTQWQPVAPRG